MENHPIETMIFNNRRRHYKKKSNKLRHPAQNNESGKQRGDDKNRNPREKSVPSIVVQSGTTTKGMERTVRTQRTLSKQDGIEEEKDNMTNYENGKSQPEQVNGKPQIQSLNSTEEPPNQNNTLHRSRSQNKVKLLVRSHAVREETSPPPEPLPEATKPESRRHKDWQQPPLSRGNSREKYEGNQVDLIKFFKDTLNRNSKDRSLLFRIEKDLVDLINDRDKTMYKFAQMSSYQRMLVHRVAAYFNMDHNVDNTGAAVIVNINKATRVPDITFRTMASEDLTLPEEPRRSILKRDSASFDETGSFKCGERMMGDSRRSKSFEEREEEYEKARRRIFNRDHSFDGDGECIDDIQWGDCDDGVFPISCEQPAPTQSRSHRLLKVESYESGDTLRANSLRTSVSKSHSFSGYEPQQSQQQAPPPPPTRVLTKQDSGSSMSSRISPSSSGYKSQRSESTLSATPSPTATPNLHSQLSAQSTTCALSPEPETVVWAVSDLSSVPPGSVLIHPQTGQPYTNPDGSIYHYDPNNPPRVVPEGTGSTQVNTASQVSQSPSKHVTCEQVAKMETGYETQYMPIPQQYAQPMEPQQIPFHQIYHPQHHQQHYQPQRTQDPMGGDLSQYMVGLSIDGSRQPPLSQTPDSRIMFWPQQGGGSFYYAPAPVTGGQRYPPQAPPHQAYIPPISSSQAHATTEHGACYGGYPAPEYMQYTTPSTLPMYYAPAAPYNSGQNNTNQSSGVQPAYYGNVSNCAPPPILAMPYAQACPHPASPHTSQGVCGQFAVYNGCYPTPYTQPTTTLPVPPQLFRKPLQVGVRCNSPLRTQYPSSPTVKDRSSDDKLQPLPVYGFRVLQGDMRLLGNAGRLPFALQPPPKAPHPRKHRTRPGGRQEVYHPANKP